MSMTNTVRLWLLNDEILYLETQRLAQQALEGAIDGAEDVVSARSEAQDELSEALRLMVQEAAPVAQGMWNELISDVLNCVDFDSLAKEELEERPIYFVYASDGSESELWLDEDEAKEWLFGLSRLSSSTPHEVQHQISQMQSGDTVEIEGVRYTLGKA